MPIGPNEDGAEAYRMYLESLPCPTCGAKESEFASLRADLAAAIAAKEEAERQWRDPERRAYQAENMISEISRELDRLGAPVLQPSAFPYSPIGRLRALIASQVGEYYGATMSIAKARAEEAERKLCRITDKVNEAQLQEEDDYVADVADILATSSPCRHAAEADALREAVEWACKNPGYYRDYSYKKSQKGFRRTTSKEWETELRRRAGGEGK